MFGKNHSSSSSNVVVNVTLDLSNPAFSGTTTVDSLNANKVITKAQLWFGDGDIANDNTVETYVQKILLRVEYIMHLNYALMWVMMVPMIQLLYLCQKNLEIQIM